MTYKLLKGFKSQTLQDVYRAIRYFHDDLRLIFFSCRSLPLNRSRTAAGLAVSGAGRFRSGNAEH